MANETAALQQVIRSVYNTRAHTWRRSREEISEVTRAWVATEVETEVIKSTRFAFIIWGVSWGEIGMGFW